MKPLASSLISTAKKDIAVWRHAKGPRLLESAGKQPPRRSRPALSKSHPAAARPPSRGWQPTLRVEVRAPRRRGQVRRLDEATIAGGIDPPIGKGLRWSPWLYRKLAFAMHVPASHRQIPVTHIEPTSQAAENVKPAFARLAGDRESRYGSDGQICRRNLPDARCCYKARPHEPETHAHRRQPERYPRSAGPRQNHGASKPGKS